MLGTRYKNGYLGFIFWFCDSLNTLELDENTIFMHLYQLSLWDASPDIKTESIDQQ